MLPERPFLTAQWTEMLLLNFEVPPAAIAAIAPAGTEPDLFEGRAYISIVGFMFRDARLFGLRFPGHSQFEEVNLRYYVRRIVDGQVRPGVVFVREIAPRPAVAAVAHWVYNESYVTRPMRNSVRMAGRSLATGDEIGYEWRTRPWGRGRWHRAAACLVDTPRLPAANSLEEFIIEHYYAYVRGRDGATWEYRVAHRPWRVAAVEHVAWDCDALAVYDNTPLAPFLNKRPAMAIVADGSPVQVFRGRRACNTLDLYNNYDRFAPSDDEMDLTGIK